MLVHLSKNSIQFEVCEKNFSHKSSFKLHMLTHTKVKAHECDICKKKFFQKGNLVDHFRIHLGEKPYGCAECGKWFTEASNRNTHIRTYHKDLSKEQLSELKCKIQRTIVYEYLKTIAEYNSTYP